MKLLIKYETRNLDLWFRVSNLKMLQNFIFIANEIRIKV